MKKNKLSHFIMALWLLTISNTIAQQVQQQVWYLKSHEIDFRQPVPVSSPIGSNFGLNPTWELNGSDGHIGVGIHGANGEIILSTYDNAVYNKFHSQIGDLSHWTYGTSSPIILYQFLEKVVNIILFILSSILFYQLIIYVDLWGGLQRYMLQ
jgi:hypothetical protein